MNKFLRPFKAVQIVHSLPLLPEDQTENHHPLISSIRNGRPKILGDLFKVTPLVRVKV